MVNSIKSRPPQSSLSSALRSAMEAAHTQLLLRANVVVISRAGALQVL
jgi:hypothetical protein